MKIFVVRIGEKYGPEYETYLEKKLSDYELVRIHEPYHPDVTLQWNKMWGMQLDIDEPICVMDIDILLVNDYKKVFDYPIKPGQFLAMPGWWRISKESGIDGRQTRRHDVIIEMSFLASLLCLWTAPSLPAPKRRPPEPHRCAALVPNASRMLLSYRRLNLWPRALQVRRLMHGLGVLCAPLRRVRELRKPQLRGCVMLQGCTAAHRPTPHY